MGGHVVVVGSYNQDHAWRVDRVPQPGETRRGQGFVTGPGGKGFNQAVGCARQGAVTHFVGALGDDALANGARATAEAEQLHGHFQTATGHPTGTACILVDADGQNQIVVDLGANQQLDPDFVRTLDTVFDGAGVVLVQLESPLPAVRAALARATEAGALRILNPAPMHDDVDAALLKLVDVLVPNEGEFAALCNALLGEQLSADAIAGMDGRSLHALARRLGVPTVVITLGARGCFVSHGEQSRGDDTVFARYPAPAVDAVDTTAAGDAFCGALAAALAAGGSTFGDAVRSAVRVASLATERSGAALSIPRRDDVDARFGG